MIKRTITALALVALGLLLTGRASGSAATQAAANEYCPVMTGTKVEADLWLDYQGQRIYFCHEVCKARFQRSPEKYLANLPAGMQQAIREHQRPAATLAQPTARSDAEQHGADAAAHSDPSSLRRFGQFLGKFHPLAVHLPIGLLLAAACAEVLFIKTHADWLAGAARFSVLLGAAAAVAAASLGWLNAMSAQFDGAMAQVLEYHRWLGTGTAALAVVVGLLSEIHRRKSAALWRRSYRLTLLLAAVSVSLTGHLGASLVYGADYLRW